MKKKTFLKFSIAYLCALSTTFCLTGCNIYIYYTDPSPTESSSTTALESIEDIVSNTSSSESLEESSISSDSIENSEKDETPTTVLDNGQCGETLYWELLSNGTLHIYGTGAMYDYVKYTTPAPWYKYRNEPYLSEDKTNILDADGNVYMSTEAYFNNNPNGYKIDEIVIDEGITYIGDWAFYRVCVEELIIPEGVESTGYFAIRYSPTLQSVVLPNSLQILNDFGISRNLALTSVVFGNGLQKIGRAGLHNNPKLQSAILPKTLTSINEQLHVPYNGMNVENLGLLDSCASLERVDFGSVTKIPQRTCLGNANLKEVVIPNTVQSIDEYAFYGCTALESVSFEQNSVCQTIGANAFSKCPALSSITGGTAITSIHASAFTSCTKLSVFEFSPLLETLHQNMFILTSIQKVDLPDTITQIPKGCFAYNTALEEVHLPQSLTTISESAFAGCSALVSVYYDGTREQWSIIDKTPYWSHGVNAQCTVYFNDGTSALLSDVK